jgi:replicative DNA helicase
MNGPEGRVPPNDLDAEASVLGGVLLSNNAIDDVLERGVTGEDFYLPSHRAIFECMVELHDQSKPMDTVTVTDALKAGENSRRTPVSESLLAALAARVPTASNIGFYARIVKEKSSLRRAIAAGGEIVGKAFANPADVSAFMDWAEQRIGAAAQREQRQSYVPIGTTVVKVAEVIGHRMDSGGTITGVPTGYIDLDRMLAGLQPADFIVLAARPSMGKSALMLNFARHAARDAGIPSLIFSLEMSKESLSERMLCMESNVDSQDVRTGRLSGNDWQTLVGNMSKIADLPMFVDDTAVQTLMEIRAKARKWRRDRDIFPSTGNEEEDRKKLGLVIIDYLQLIRGSGGDDNREREVALISQGLKALAKELHLPVLALAQLNRKVEQRENKRPNLADLRESGAIEQDADVIAFIYRPCKYEESKKDDKTAEVIVGKQRNGPTGTVNLCFLDYCGRFENMDERREE